MNKDNVIKRLNELSENGYKSIWIILKHSNAIGAMCSDIINDSSIECIYIKHNVDTQTIPYSDIVDIKFIY